MNTGRHNTPKWLQDKRLRLALEQACPQCGRPKKQKCGVPSGFHAARADYAYQVRKTKRR